MIFWSRVLRLMPIALPFGVRLRRHYTWLEDNAIGALCQCVVLERGLLVVWEIDAVFRTVVDPDHLKSLPVTTLLAIQLQCLVLSCCHYNKNRKKLGDKIRGMRSYETMFEPARVTDDSHLLGCRNSNMVYMVISQSVCLPGYFVVRCF